MLQPIPSTRQQLPSLPSYKEYIPDIEWLETTRRLASETYNRLNLSVQSAQLAGERQQLREALMQLGKHLEDSGDFLAALARFSSRFLLFPIALCA